jgi:uncharacterized Tic20 family protein
MSEPRKGLAVASLVVGIASIYPFIPIGFIVGPVAIWLGNSHRDDARQLGQQPSAMATAGRICGIVATILSILLWLAGIILGSILGY